LEAAPGARCKQRRVLLTAVAIFAATYLLVSARRLGLLPLGRPGAALLGAIACVVASVLTPKQALAAIDGHTLVLLFGMMGMGAFLALDGFPERAQSYIARRVRTRARLLSLLVYGSGIAAAFLTNDAVCVFGAPLVVALIKRHGLPPLPFLIALATASNTGSVATLVGNPQNMLCAQLGKLEYQTHLLLMLPVAAIGLVLNHLLLRWVFRRELQGDLEPASSTPPLITRPIAVTLSAIGGTTLFYLAGYDLAAVAVSGFTLLLVVHRREASEVWPRIDWSILVFFAALFVVVEGLVKSGASSWFFARWPLANADGHSDWWRLSVIFLVGSNLVSNVPFILVVREQVAALPDPRLGWELLAMSSTFAGNLTLLGSVANIIVAESARDLGGLGFWAYLRVGFPLAVITTALGTAWLMMVAGG
jgi:Na+/H+ antiporter NhaD/arsenite permease-like protein